MCIFLKFFYADLACPLLSSCSLLILMRASQVSALTPQSSTQTMAALQRALIDPTTTSICLLSDGLPDNGPCTYYKDGNEELVTERFFKYMYIGKYRMYIDIFKMITKASSFWYSLSPHCSRGTPWLTSHLSASFSVVELAAILQALPEMLKRRRVRIHTISFNCDDSMAIEFLRRVAALTDGSFTCV